MSDTPRTDDVYCDKRNDSAIKTLDAMIQHAMQLERELAAAQAECAALDTDRHTLALRVEKLQKECEKLQSTLNRITDAVENAGKNPQYHWKMLDECGKRMPTLFLAIKEAIYAKIQITKERTK